ncbi:winged helix-turn-helix domain-containing protein [Rhizobium etli]|uniref:winged helix-turn-helix domain-containing protein n=1 Tax=Rhizobium etli TaxID=29449 RepID=UPI0009D64C97
METGPIPAIHGVVRWRLKDLARLIFEDYRISLDESTVGRELKAMGFAKLSARPRHYAQNELAVEDLKKFPGRDQRDQQDPRSRHRIELWWQDEARIGQKNKMTRRWAQRGTRPSAPHDQRPLPNTPNTAEASTSRTRREHRCSRY